MQLAKFKLICNEDPGQNNLDASLSKDNEVRVAHFDKSKSSLIGWETGLGNSVGMLSWLFQSTRENPCQLQDESKLVNVHDVHPTGGHISECVSVYECFWGYPNMLYCVS